MKSLCQVPDDISTYLPPTIQKPSDLMDNNNIGEDEKNEDEEDEDEEEDTEDEAASWRAMLDGASFRSGSSSLPMPSNRFRNCSLYA